MNVLIVEDETYTAELLKEMIEKDPDFLVTAIMGSIMDTVQFLSKHQNKIDLMFLDIQLEDGYCFEIFKHIDIMIPVIFCTAYDEYTLQAIKSNGIEYILKPFQENEIVVALHKFKKFVGHIQNKGISSLIMPIVQQAYQESFLTQVREKSVVIYTKDVATFFIENEVVHMFTFDGGKYPLFKNMEYVEEACSPQLFFRINRQMIINRNAVISMQPYFNRKMILQLKVQMLDKPVISRLKVSAFKEWLETG